MIEYCYAQENLSAKKEKEKKKTWLLKEDENKDWPGDYQAASSKRKKETFRLMLSKKHRLPLRYELHRVQKEGEVYQFPYFALLLARNNLGFSRFAFIVSNKIHKRATKRNRIKRLLRESVRSFLPITKPGFDGVFLAKKSILGKDFKTTQSAVNQAFEKTGLL